MQGGLSRVDLLGEPHLANGKESGSGLEIEINPFRQIHLAIRKFTF